MSERRRSPVEEKKPSDALNEVFTPLMVAFRDKVETTRWLEIPEIRSRRVDDKINKSEVKKMPQFDRYFLFIDYPEVFTHAKSKLELFKPPPFLTFPQTTVSIGEYGEEWSRRLMSSAETLMDGAASDQSKINILSEALIVNHNNEDLLDRYTFRKSVNYSERGGKTTIAEGFQSTLFVAGFLTQYKVPGYEEKPDELLRDLADQGVFSQLSLVIAPGLTAAMGNTGVVFTDPTLVKDSSDKLRIRPDIIKHFHDEKDGAYKSYRDGSETGAAEKLDRPGCPVGRKLPGAEESGVDIAAKLFAKTVAVQGK